MAKTGTKRTTRGNAATGNGWFPPLESLPAQVEERRERLWAALRTLEDRLVRLRGRAKRETAVLVRSLRKQFQRELARLRGRTQALAKPAKRHAGVLLRTFRDTAAYLEQSARRQAQRVVIEQLELAARKDIDSLRRRVEAMEKQLARLHKEKTAHSTARAVEAA